MYICSIYTIMLLILWFFFRHFVAKSDGRGVLFWDAQTVPKVDEMHFFLHTQREKESYLLLYSTRPKSGVGGAKVTILLHFPKLANS